jgi:hypothetical protein
MELTLTTKPEAGVKAHLPLPPREGIKKSAWRAGGMLIFLRAQRRQFIRR